MAAPARARFRPGQAVAVSAGSPAYHLTLMLDTALLRREHEGRPIRVGMIGAGATGRAISLQLGTPVPGIRLAGIANRTPANAERAFRDAGINAWQNTDQPSIAAESI